MADEFDRIAALGVIPSSHVGRLRFLPVADRSIVGTIQLGVIFVMAFWSGSSRLAFARVKRVLSEVDSEGRLEFVVVDTDGCPDLYEMPPFVGHLHGNGETAWVKSGQVVNLTTGASPPDSTEAFTRQLLHSVSQG